MRWIAVPILLPLIVPTSTRAYESNDVYRLMTTKSCERCDLSGAYLVHPDLLGAEQPATKLWRAKLAYADLSSAQLFNADLISSDLSKAKLAHANLTGAGLTNSNLSGADASFAKFARANLIDARLSHAKLQGTDLSFANLYRAQLDRAHLFGATLLYANLASANLTRAQLVGANLIGADLTGSKLSGADLTGANLKGAVFEPETDKLPNLLAIRASKNLFDMRFDSNPDALVALRKSFKEAGRRDLERQITYAIERSKREREPWFEASVWTVLFEWPSDYDMAPLRPILIMFGMILAFTGFYVNGLTAHGPNGIWKVWPADRVLRFQGKSDPELVKVGPWTIYAWALWFSILSAFHFGWRDLNVGTWIARIQSSEYTLRASGWVRTVSGVQSITSVYLIALAVLTYFGRPFE